MPRNDRATRERPDLIVLDLKLTGSSRLELLRRLVHLQNRKSTNS
jgi:CheY-like chemotaxis protein